GAAAPHRPPGAELRRLPEVHRGRLPGGPASRSRYRRAARPAAGCAGECAPAREPAARLPLHAAPASAAGAADVVGAPRGSRPGGREPTKSVHTLFPRIPLTPGAVLSQSAGRVGSSAARLQGTVAVGVEGSPLGGTVMSTRRTTFVLLLCGLVLGGLVPRVRADSITIGFEPSEGYATGSIDKQPSASVFPHDWAGTLNIAINPSIDQAVSTAGSCTGTQSFRMSSSTT